MAQSIWTRRGADRHKNTPHAMRKRKNERQTRTSIWLSRLISACWTIFTSIALNFVGKFDTICEFVCLYSYVKLLMCTRCMGSVWLCKYLLTTEKNVSHTYWLGENQFSECERWKLTMVPRPHGISVLLEMFIFCFVVDVFVIASNWFNYV